MLKRYREGIFRMERELGCFFYVDYVGMEKSFLDSDFRFKNQQMLSSIDGMVIGLKDMIFCKGMPINAGSKILEGTVAAYDATVVTKLKDAGAIIAGKLNQDEFAMGSSGENNGYKITRNPWILSKTTGGSSSGSAAAVSANLVEVALGTDTGGSVRQPASFCGVVGLKPTYGRVSRYGIVAYASSLDQIGVFSNDVQKVAQVLQCIAGYDEKDATSIDIPVPCYENLLKQEIAGIKIGILGNFFDLILDEDIKRNFNLIVSILQKNGVSVNCVTIPHIEASISVYYILATAEASSNLARYDGLRYGASLSGSRQGIEDTRGVLFGEEVKRRIFLGNYVLSSNCYSQYYLQAQGARQKIKDGFEKAFKEVDLIICPTTPTKAYDLGEKTSSPLEMYLGDIFTVPVNLVGLPGISIPISCEELPIGMQIIGRSFSESKILNLAYWIQELLKGASLQ